MKNELFDFGFTIVDEQELDSVEELTTTASDYQNRLEKLYNAIQPLLANLKNNPEKDYILWKNRLEKIEEFEEYILTIYQGK
jgi:hypothetical protein